MSEEFNDEYAGKGGSYLVGEDGKRVLQVGRASARHVGLKPDLQPSPPLPAGEGIEAGENTQPKPKAKGDKNA